jgi:hypothetical protein
MTCRCGKPTRDDAYVCDTCADSLAKTLGDVAWLADELEVTITKQRGIPASGGGGATADCSCTPDDIDASRCKHGALPWHDAASGARTHLHALLVSWVRLCHEEGVRHQSPDDDLPDDDLVALARWLLWRVDGLMLHPAGPDAADEIADAYAACERLIDRRPDRWYAGPCVVEDERGKECGTDLYARSTRGDVECRTCGATYDVATRRAWLLAAAEDRLANATEVARAVSWLGAEPLTPARVWKWAERGRIVAKGHDGRAPLYRIGDAIDLLADDTRRTA